MAAPHPGGRSLGILWFSAFWTITLLVLLERPGELVGALAAYGATWVLFTVASHHAP
ncbi:MAG: hypothetical protein U0R80_19710 [Nocardioidaceae bacterium]